MLGAPELVTPRGSCQRPGADRTSGGAQRGRSSREGVVGGPPGLPAEAAGRHRGSKGLTARVRSAPWWVAQNHCGLELTPETALGRSRAPPPQTISPPYKATEQETDPETNHTVGLAENCGTVAAAELKTTRSEGWTKGVSSKREFSTQRECSSEMRRKESESERVSPTHVLHRRCYREFSRLRETLSGGGADEQERSDSPGRRLNRQIQTGHCLCADGVICI